MRISVEDKQFLIEHIKTAEPLIQSNNIGALLEEIDGFMTEHGYAPPNYDELNELGRQAERIYDRIYHQNE